MSARDLTFDDVAARIAQMPGRPLLPHQAADIQRIIADDGQALVAACVGSGKTGTGVGLMAVLRGVWLIVAPLSVLPQWEEALAEWAPDAKVSYVNSKNKTALIDLYEDKTETELHVHLIGWEYLRTKDFAKYKNIDGAICDESHRAAGHGTMTSKKLWHVNSTWRVGLSGTIAGNKVQGLYNICRWIWWGNKDRKIKRSYQRYELYMGQPGVDEFRAWVRRHFYLVEKPNFYGRDTGMEIGPEKFVGSVVSEVPTYIQHLEDQPCCIHHPEGVNATLPDDEEPITIHVDMTPAQAKVYYQLAPEEKGDAKKIGRDKPMAMWLDTSNGDRAAVVNQNEMVRRTRKRQVALATPTVGADGDIQFAWDAKSSKADALLDLLQDIVEPTEPVLVFTHSKQFANMMVERINKKYGKSIRAAAWTGDQSMDERMATKAAFGTEGGPNVIVATLATVGTGTDGLQLVCRREVWLSWDEDNLLNTQGRGRLRRRGQERRVQSWDIVTRGTIEQRVNANKRSEKRVLDNALNASHNRKV